MRRRHKRSSRKRNQAQLQKSVLKFLSKKPGKAYAPGTISSKLKGKNSRDAVYSAIAKLVAERRIIIDKNGKCKIHPEHVHNKKKESVETLEGTIDLTASGGAYVVVPSRDRDTYIPRKYVNGALQGDTVLIEVRKQYHGRKSEGRVVKIVKRKRISFIGIFQDYVNWGYVFVETPKMTLDIKVLPQYFNSAESGDGVVVDVVDFGDGKHKDIIGKVVTVLPRDNRNDFEMNSILVNNGFDIAFPTEVKKQVSEISDDIPSQEIAKRTDLRSLTTFTIDPESAKDFDDALSYSKIDDTNIQIGVHIADVTHYVKGDTALDKEAFKRSTSVYLVDRVCPMLPEKLSNELCSLRPNEDKLTFSVLLTFNEDSQLIDSRIEKTIIHSDHRFTYEEAQEIIEGKKHDFTEAITTMNNIAMLLHDKRFTEGAVNFQSAEVKMELDDQGVPVKISKKERIDAHSLIEEFMLLANKVVASYIRKKVSAPEIPFVYRIHDLPDPDKLTNLTLLASEFGIRLNFDTPKKTKLSLNHLNSSEVDEEIRTVLSPLAIRCMAKAEYSTDNIGHFGLGFENYSHFTSPIRRYSDVLAHRILFENLNALKRKNKSKLEDQCHYISLREKDAVNAERESIKYKKVEFYLSRLGTVERGIVRNIIDRGFFVELDDSQADGFVSFESINDRVIIHPAKIKLTFMNSDRVIRIGDRIEVIIEDADLDRRQIDLTIRTDTL